MTRRQPATHHHFKMSARPTDLHRAVEERDWSADERDRVSRGSLASDDRAGAARDREQAAADRAEAGLDRRRAAHERRHAGVDDLTGALRRDRGSADLQREI